ncbi:uncharacterized protein LOC111637564 [Centruroides sculpturatus]|uniref:uncharacterized protein LOC111637564 n=1 Tax=Centruroides sculpturatus TaxID=218467 RepID=UPI000C6D7D1D|nr:uncharacterized protein LOC111637564 [Centruroides sculpturatus]XP_023238840.1 uncharacterized protein LOC111637564 [Centruroides sculpturatus]XP_023238841.1 uncharacterized protein LOC111637564 [Centruroides sculpturatus]
MGNYISKLISNFRKIEVFSRKNSSNFIWTRSDRCVYYNFYATFSVCKVFGIEPFEKCCCFNDRIYGMSQNTMSTFYSYYVNILQCFLWLSSLSLFLMIFNENYICHRCFHLYKKYGIEMNVVLLILNIYVAIQFTILKRNKVFGHFIKSTYLSEKQLPVQLEVPLLGYLFCVFVIALFVSNAAAINVFPTVKKYAGSEYEATFCSIYFSLLFLQLTGQICSVLFVFSICGIIIAKRLMKLSEELQQINTTSLLLKNELQGICEKHTEIWEIFQMINKKWRELSALIYAHFTYETCFLCYAALFFDFNLQSRVFFSGISLIFLTGSLLVSWSLSYLTSLVIIFYFSYYIY